jgi:thiol-disulfide isomerase/thioredoxin/tetratricopeptide (TPR) repeat protein
MGESSVEKQSEWIDWRRVLDEYQAARAAGQASSLEEFLSHHPDTPPLVRAQLSSLRTEVTVEVRDVPQPDAEAARESATVTSGLGLRRVMGPFPQQFGDYELLEELGHGGMGIVFRARQKSLQRTVALKMILAGHLATLEQLRRFRMEAEAAASLDHPNIVPVYHVGEVEGLPYYVMKFMEGGSLRDRLRQTRFQPREVAALVATLARAVHYAHQRGILHRDLKPANILLDPEDRPHIVDFGLARHLAAHTTTQTGSVAGTPAYMAPEQAAGRKDLTVAVDIYSLGAILYELLTGHPPFRGASATEVLLQVMEQDVESPRRFDPFVDRDLETICLRCLEKDPTRRYPSAEKLAEDLERWLKGEPIGARPVGWWERTVKWARRRPATAMLVAVSTLAALVLFGGGWWMSAGLGKALQLAEAQRQEAEHQRAEADRQRTEAVKSWQEAQRLRELAEQRTQEVQEQADRVRVQLGRRVDYLEDYLLRIDGRLAHAGAPVSVRVEFVQDAIRLSEELLKENPTDARLRTQAARLYGTLGTLQREERTADALAAFDRALQLQRPLAEQNPNNPNYAFDLATTYSDRALLLARLRRYSNALEDLDQAVHLADGLTKRFPAQKDYAQRASECRIRRGNVYEEMGRSSDAEMDYRQAVNAYEVLLASPSDVPDHWTGYARGAESLALLLERRDPAEAELWYLKALDARRRAYHIARSPHYERLFRATYLDLARWAKEASRPKLAARLAEQIRQDFLNEAVQTYNAACFLAHAALTTPRGSATGREEADRYASAAVTMLRKAIHEGFRNFHLMELDLDLDPLRDRSDFRDLMVEVQRLYPAPSATPADKYEQLVRQFSSEEQQYRASLQRAETIAERRKAWRLRPDLDHFANKFFTLARDFPDTPVAVDALVWILETTDRFVAAPQNTRSKWRRIALQALLEDCLQNPAMGRACERLARSPSPDYEDLFRKVAQEHHREDVRGLALYALALSLQRRAEAAQKHSDASAADLVREAEQHFEQVVTRYGSLALGRTTVGAVAEAKLYELRHLSLGRVAPEIEGLDLEGRPMKLSDFHGRVVVLDFWADWCGWCRVMYPHEKQLVQRYQGRPFVLLGINVDEDRQQALRAVQKEQLTWRSWWDGGPSGQRIARQWQVDAYPTIYVLDAQGVIRYKFQGYVREPLDAAVDQLVSELEGAHKKP